MRRLQRRDLQLPRADGRARRRSAIASAPRCDTEVIVHAWEEWGEACVERFRGMFAFALWDRTQRDAVPGPRPPRREAAVLRRARDGTLLFGSELKALLLHPGFAREIDPRGGRGLLRLGYVPDPRTIYRGVAQAAAGPHADRAPRRAGAGAARNTGTSPSTPDAPP